MSWLTAVQDVRKVLSDGPTDKLRYRKKLIGQQDGSNLIFKTFEMRRVTNFVTAVAPLGVYKNNVLVSVSGDDLESGELTLVAAPANGDSLVATYYVQWFTDSEIEQFLVSSSQWIGFADSYTAISEDLRPAAKEYAAFQGYQKLSAKFAENLAETYQLYDAPDGKRFDPVQAYMKIAKVKYDLAVQLRNDVYERKGQSKAPLSATLSGSVKDVPPNR